jgi:uncharacterized small protein (DUF1192 family)
MQTSATSADRPRFRQDLVAEPIEDGDARFIDVMDPDSGQLFRFYEVEYSLACAMDGQRDVASIVKWAEEELGLKPSASEVRTVIATLGDLGYLERGVDAAAAASAPLTEPAPLAREPSAAAAQPSAAGVPTSRPKTPPADVPSSGRSSTPPSDTPAVKNQPEAPAFNRWDQPTAMGDSDDYLNKLARAKGGPDVELGAPGVRGEASDQLPRAPELQLGSAGAAAKQRGGDDIALGASGASSVSTDLAVDVPVRRDDVKEAVRAAHGDGTREAAKPAATADAKPAARAEAKPAEAAKAGETKPAEAKAAKPGEKPTERPVLPTAPTAPSSGVSPILIGLLVLVVLGAGGFLVYKYVLKKDAGQTSATAPTPPPQQPEPPPPAVDTAKLAIEQPEPREIKPTEAGQLASIVATDTTVKAGEPIARLVGFQPVENQVNALQKEIDKATANIAKLEGDRDAAAAAGNTTAATAAETKLASAQKTLADRAAKLSAQISALEKFLIKAPVDGKVTAVATANARITPTDIIATLTPDPMLVATFKSAGEAATDAKVLLAVTNSEQRLACTVVGSGEDGVKIACPQQDGAAEGAEVTFAGLDPAAPDGENDGDIGTPDATAPAAPDQPATGESASVDEAPPGAVAPKQVAPRAPNGDLSPDKPDKPAEPAPTPAPDL